MVKLKIENDASKIRSIADLIRNPSLISIRGFQAHELSGMTGCAHSDISFLTRQIPRRLAGDLRITSADYLLLTISMVSLAMSSSSLVGTT